MQNINPNQRSTTSTPGLPTFPRLSPIDLRRPQPLPHTAEQSGTTLAPYRSKASTLGRSHSEGASLSSLGFTRHQIPTISSKGPTTIIRSGSVDPTLPSHHQTPQSDSVKGKHRRRNTMSRLIVAGKEREREWIPDENLSTPLGRGRSPGPSRRASTDVEGISKVTPISASRSQPLSRTASGQSVLYTHRTPLSSGERGGEANEEGSLRLIGNQQLSGSEFEADNEDEDESPTPPSHVSLPKGPRGIGSGEDEVEEGVIHLDLGLRELIPTGPLGGSVTSSRRGRGRRSRGRSRGSVSGGGGVPGPSSRPSGRRVVTG